jgi:hypothetical protein
MFPLPQPLVNSQIQFVPVETRQPVDNFSGGNALALLAVGYLLGSGRRQCMMPPQVWIVDGHVRS